MHIKLIFGNFKLFHRRPIFSRTSVLIHPIQKLFWYVPVNMMSSLSGDMVESSYEKYVKRLKKYNSLQPDVNPELCSLVDDLTACIVTQLDNEVQLITLPSGSTVFSGVVVNSSARFLYIRSFYPDLLKRVRSKWRTVLLSNPGTGKSMFQWYYLARLLNPHAFSDALTCDSAGKADPPEVVIRQVGQSHMQIFSLKARVAHTVGNASSFFSVLDCFDPATTVYFFEPENTKVEPMWGSTTMSMLATCSPELSRYKEFCKNGATKLYMPLYTEDELLTIGRHMRQQPDFPADLMELYSDDNIHHRYAEYGGIIRHVLPHDRDYVQQLISDKKEAIDTTDWRKCFANPNIENSHISHLVIQYKVDVSSFSQVTFAFVNKNAESQALEYLERLNLNDMLHILRNMRSSNVFAIASRAIYENLVASYLVKGKPELFRRALKAKPNDDSTRFAPKLAEMIETEVVNFCDMKMRTLYKPKIKNFAFVDFYYKDKIEENLSDDAIVFVQVEGVDVPVRNVMFVGINACSGTSEPSQTRKFKTFRSLKKKLDLPDNLLFDFLFCPHPEVVSSSKPTVKSIPKGTVLRTSVLVAPDFINNRNRRQRYYNE